MDRAALGRKYRVLRALRASPDRAALGPLSAEFPGAVRELDELPLEEIERRIAELDSAAPLRPELRAVARFHELLREARAASAAVAAGGRPSRAALAALAAELEVSVVEAHRLVFPFAHVRRGL